MLKMKLNAISIDDRDYDSLTFEEKDEKFMTLFGIHYQEPTLEEKNEILKKYGLPPLEK